MPAPPDDLAARCGPIELLLVDVDGVLTDGVIALDDRGVETKHFHVRDGSAIGRWRAAAAPSARSSRRSSGARAPGTAWSPGSWRPRSAGSCRPAGMPRPPGRASNRRTG